ncbi:acetyltransferase [Flavobacterium sp.]|uniref:acetyltransferase n=1 Tax=Flavobacterium sp. TaxID=239 RepID=UPI003750CFF7
MEQNKLFLVKEIKRLSNLLDVKYNNELNFRNHCYLRIAFDATIGDKWDLKVKKPFVKNATEEQLTTVLQLLNKYIIDKNSLLFDNEKSLLFRENQKIIENKLNPELF